VTDSADSFADVKTLGKHLTGLLDTGASVSVLGKGCRELVETLGVTVQPHFSVVRTASGEDRSVIGRLELPVKYKGVSKPDTFYLCPYLDQKPVEQSHNSSVEARERQVLAGCPEVKRIDH